MVDRRSTTERGLGSAHQKARKRLLAALIEGVDRCPYCGEPMWLSQQLDADHSQPRAMGGGLPDRLSHARCNRAAGGKLSGQLRRGSKPKLCPYAGVGDHPADCTLTHSVDWYAGPAAAGRGKDLSVPVDEI